MNRRQSGGEGTPGPGLGTGPLTRPDALQLWIGAPPGGSESDAAPVAGASLPGHAGAFPGWMVSMPANTTDAQDEGGKRERIARLIEARDRLADVLELLDAHSQSPAAANVDLAIHHLSREIGG